ncbi:neuronal acetylcholine receptor subunit beta-2-like [Mytilus galloprovincialis]|uniref:neuronal acetylcholine receptor subunit beta-2-like n=1 Tax=Mytilus galloprovincialis TaxID=29158 RepID=UPI003F7C66C9
MAKCCMLYLVYLLIYDIHDVQAYSFEILSNLTTELFQIKSYDKTLRPRNDQSQNISLDVKFNFLSINKFDELEGKLVCTAFLGLAWTDDFLTWDYSTYPIGRFTLPQTLVWKPDFVLRNGFTEFKELGGSFYNVILTVDGDVAWNPYQVFETKCALDVTYFPFDSQTCDIVFTMWSHFTFQVSINPTVDNIIMGEYTSNALWTIESTSQNVDNTGSRSVITYSLNIKRKPSYYVSTIILPVVFLGILNILVFVLPADAGEKMSYSITVALGFMVFLTLVSTQLPANSDNISMLSVYIQIQICLGIFALVVSSIQLRIRHRDPNREPNKTYKYLVSFSRRCCKSENQVQSVANKQTKENIDLDERVHAFDWNDVSSAIDFISFWFFTVIFLLSTLIIMILMAVG